MKKLIISTAALAPALKKLSQAVSSNAPLPVLKNLYCRVTPGQLELIGTNTEITIFYRMECEMKEEFEFLAPFDLLSKIVAINKNCPLEIEAGKHVRIKGPDDNYDIKVSEKLEDFPKLPEVPKKNSFELNADIVGCLGTALTTAANPNKDHRLSHVLLELSPGKVTIASTDGAHMVFSEEFASENQETEEILISQPIVKALTGFDAVKTSYHKKAISFEQDNITIITTRSEYKFVNFRAVFPPEWPSNLTVNRGQLLEALDKCSLSSDETKSTIVSISDKEMKFTADDHTVKINVSIPCSYTGTVGETTVNSDRLLKLLNQLDNDEIQLAVHDGKKAIVITIPDDAGYKGMIMPIASK